MMLTLKSCPFLSKIIYEDPKGNIFFLLTGPTGSYKTVLMTSIIVNSLKYNDLYAVYLDGSGLGKEFERYLSELGVPIFSPLVNGRLLIYDLVKLYREYLEKDVSEILYTVYESAKEALYPKLGAIVLDPLDSPYIKIRKDFGIEHLARTINHLKNDFKLIGIVVTENNRTKEMIEQLSVIADAWLRTGFEKIGERTLPYVTVQKFRRIKHSYDKHPILFTTKGINLGESL